VKPVTSPEIAFMTASMLDRSWDEALDAARRNDIALIEACGGGHIPKRHFDPVALAADSEARERFRASLDSRGQRVCAFSCHGNPLHPDQDVANAAHRDFVAMCELAAEMGVHHVSLLAGCPAGGPDDRTPNWIIQSALPDTGDAYRWQWEERVIPYWQEAARIADSHGVVICVEPHSGDVVYNLETFQRLRDEVGPVIGMNYDPSHLWWQGIDPCSFIDATGDAIATCHMKDARFDHVRIGRTGVASAKPYDAWDERPWTFSTPGYGHADVDWAKLVAALRRVGYSGALSIECEDPFMSPDDTLVKSVTLLRRVLPAEAPPPVGWARVAFT
jgi:sugar phosphate isomerase/epimerase